MCFNFLLNVISMYLKQTFLNLVVLIHKTNRTFEVLDRIFIVILRAKKCNQKRGNSLKYKLVCADCRWFSDDVVYSGIGVFYHIHQGKQI